MNRTLLHIDRDPSVRLLLQKGLSCAGFDVLPAEDIVQGRSLALGARPDAVLVDLDGVEVPPAQLAETLRHTPGLEAAALLASTAEDRPEHLQQAESCGFTAVLLKPLDLDVLASHLEPHVAPRPGRTTNDAPAARLPMTLPLVLRALAPLVESLVETVSIADAVIVLDPGAGPVVVAAAYSVRPSAPLPAVGTRVTLDAVPWLAEAVRTQQPSTFEATELPSSTLIADGITRLLVVPLAGETRNHGAVVLGERRRRTFAFPPAQVEQAVRETGRIAFAIEQFDRLRTAIVEARRDVERYRAAMTRSVAAGASGHRDERHDAAVELSLRVAHTLGLGPAETERVRHRAEVHDAGHTWLRQALLAHVRVKPEIRDRLLDLHADLDAEILSGLGWPLARSSAPGGRLAWARPGDTPGGLELTVQVVRTVTAYCEKLAGKMDEPRERARAIASLRQEATGPEERQVLDALVTTLTAAGASLAG